MLPHIYVTQEVGERVDNALNELKSRMKGPTECKPWQCILCILHFLYIICVSQCVMNIEFCNEYEFEYI